MTNFTAQKQLFLKNFFNHFHSYQDTAYHTAAAVGHQAAGIHLEPGTVDTPDLKRQGSTWSEQKIFTIHYIPSHQCMFVGKFVYLFACKQEYTKSTGRINTKLGGRMQHG